jgi:hypothetical protein
MWKYLSTAQNPNPPHCLDRQQGGEQAFGFSTILTSSDSELVGRARFCLAAVNFERMSELLCEQISKWQLISMMGALRFPH